MSNAFLLLLTIASLAIVGGLVNDLYSTGTRTGDNDNDDDCRFLKNNPSGEACLTKCEALKRANENGDSRIGKLCNQTYGLDFCLEQVLKGKCKSERPPEWYVYKIDDCDSLVGQFNDQVSCKELCSAAFLTPESAKSNEIECRKVYSLKAAPTAAHCLIASSQAKSVCSLVVDDLWKKLRFSFSREDCLFLKGDDGCKEMCHDHFLNKKKKLVFKEENGNCAGLDQCLSILNSTQCQSFRLTEEKDWWFKYEEDNCDHLVGIECVQVCKRGFTRDNKFANEINCRNKFGFDNVPTIAHCVAAASSTLLPFNCTIDETHDNSSDPLETLLEQIIQTYNM